MSLMGETSGTQGQLASTLHTGLDVIDQNQTVTFNLYRKWVSPIDGYVFWIRADIIKPGAMAPLAETTALTFQAQGSLHHTTTNRQDPDESFSTHHMIFTSKVKVNDLAEIAPDTMYLAETATERYTFSSRSMWYRQSELYHYSGDAVYPTMASQIIEDIHDFDMRNVVVSNSLPFWLQFDQLFPVYPAFLVPDNIEPPYAIINISDNDTTVLQSAPIRDATGTRTQLTKDVVRVVTYGVRNDKVLDWIDMIVDYGLGNADKFGVMNSPIPRDSQRGQTEISALAQKKVIHFDVNYYQTRSMEMARQLITKAFLNIIAQPVTA